MTERALSVTDAYVPREVRPQGNAELLRRSAARTPEVAALMFEGRSWFYRELWEAVCGCADDLAALGVGPGDRVAVLGRNSDRYVITFLATQLLAAVHVPVNFMLSAREVGYIVEHSGASVGLADPELLETLRAGARGSGCRVRALELPAAVAAKSFAEPAAEPTESAAEPAEPAESAAEPAEPAAPVIDADTLAQIAYTSGTESAPKGAMLAHGGLQAQYLSCIAAGEYLAGDVFVQALPLYHCAQLHCFMMPALALGARSVLLAAPDPAAVIEAIAEHNATSVFAPPTVWIALLAHPRFRAEVVGSLRKGYYGAAIMPVHVIHELSQRLPELRLWNFYGQTELGPLATCLPPEEQLSRAGSAGRPVLHVQTRVVDDAMRDVDPGEVGEVVHRSVQVMLGYYRDPERSAAATAGGWFHSGDLATRDAEGYITIVDRKKDMINTGGENVSSREVEEVLFEHPAVAEVAVIAVPDERWIEAVCAVVVVRDGARASEPEIRSFARERLAGYKTPKRIIFLDALPKNPSGKILKRELRETVLAS